MVPSRSSLRPIHRTLCHVSESVTRNRLSTGCFNEHTRRRYSFNLSRCGNNNFNVEYGHEISIIRRHGFRLMHNNNNLPPGLSTRDIADLEDRIWSNVGSKVKDPELSVDIKSLGWLNRRLAISDDGTIQILLRLPTLLHPSLDELKSSIQKVANDEISAWASNKGIDMSNNNKVNVEAIATKPTPWLVKNVEDQKEMESRHGPGLANVAHCIAVYSCKGGVGKSTVAVNLAYELARLGGRIGLLDVDVYGPSLPVLIEPKDLVVRRSPLGKGMVYPIEHEGVKVLSLGFVSPQSGVPGSGQSGGASVLRGPMAGKVVTQLLKGTDWGELDILILDLPPGTGDVQLTICQETDLSGAVGVTTPSKLAIADALKGIEMFSSLDIPTIALVENMAYFECEGGGKHFPFGKGLQNLTDDDENALHLGLTNDKICQLPVSSSANDANDSANPLCLSRPDTADTELHAFERLARIVSKELFQLNYRNPGGETQGFVTFEGNAGKFEVSSIELSSSGDSLVVRAFSDSGAIQMKISPNELKCRDPKSGEKIVITDDDTSAKDDNDENTEFDEKSGITMFRTKKKQVGPTTAHPERIEKKASVGYEISWSDGAKFIYSRRAIAIAAGGSIVR